MRNKRRFITVFALLLLITFSSTACRLEKDSGQEREVTLYFADQERTMLVKETRTVTLSATEPLPDRILKCLQEGPEEEDHLPVLPEEMDPPEIYQLKGVLYVNMDRSFAQQFVGTSRSGELMVYAIVDSLTEIGSVTRVQLLIEGERWDEFPGGIRIDEPLKRREELIKQ